jgi:hypothetical protein
MKDVRAIAADCGHPEVIKQKRFRRGVYEAGAFTRPLLSSTSGCFCH